MLAFDSWCQRTLGKTPNIKILGVKPIFLDFWCDRLATKEKMAHNSKTEGVRALKPCCV